MKKKTIPLRSIRWFGRQDIYGFIYRSWVKNRGVPHDQFDGADLDFLAGKSGSFVPRDNH